jgi:hypothetical protein
MTYCWDAADKVPLVACDCQHRQIRTPNYPKYVLNSTSDILYFIFLFYSILMYLYLLAFTSFDLIDTALHNGTENTDINTYHNRIQTRDPSVQAVHDCALSHYNGPSRHDNRVSGSPAHVIMPYNTSRVPAVLLRRNSTNVYISYQSLLPESL